MAQTREGVGAKQWEPMFGTPTPTILGSATTRLAHRLNDVKISDDAVVDVLLDLFELLVPCHVVARYG